VVAAVHAEEAVTLATEHGFALWATYGMILRGWVVGQQGNHEESIAQIQRGLALVRTMGAELVQSWFQLMLAEAYGSVGKFAEGLAVIGDALEGAQRRGELAFMAELYRVRGELTLNKLSVVSCQLSVPSTQPLRPSAQAGAEAETSFLKAIDIARQQQAKSWELRAAMSLVRLRQRQARHPAPRTPQDESRTALAEAHRVLAESYRWFTEGFDTPDLREAKALLEALSE
jgi:predicted ATPase